MDTWGLLGLDMAEHRAVALVGAGGKSSTMYALARQARDTGRTVIVTTTTHIMPHPRLPLTDDPDPERLRALSLYARKGLTDRGLTIRPSALEAPTPIIPIYTYETYRTLRVAAEIYDRGVYVNPTLPPATPEGEALLRTSYMATHTEALLDEAMDIIGEVMARE